MKHFEEKVVLVTGGAGFIGSHLVDHLIKYKAFVKVIDDLSNGSIGNISNWVNAGKCEFHQGDIRDDTLLNELLKDVDIVYHQAAKVSVSLSVENPKLVTDVNVIGTTTLLDACRKNDVEKFIVASSSSVYGDTPILPKIETMKPAPLSPYAVSKLTQEHMALAFHSTYGMNTTALRYFNVYGPRQRGGPYAGVISIFVKQGLNNEKMTIEGDGGQTRDFTYIDDAIQANLKAASSKHSEGNFYNVGGGSKITILELASLIANKIGVEFNYVNLPPRPGDIRDSLADLESIRKDLGYIPQMNIQAGIENTINWMKE